MLGEGMADVICKIPFSRMGFEGKLIQEVWRKIWDLNVPIGIKTFIWKTVSEVLLAKQKLFKRTVVKNAFCPICMKKLFVMPCGAVQNHLMCGQKHQVLFKNGVAKRLIFSVFGKGW